MHRVSKAPLTESAANFQALIRILLNHEIVFKLVRFPQETRYNKF